MERPACFGSFRRRAVKQPTKHRRYDLAAPATFIRRATRLPMLGDCASIATLCHDRLSERSYLFTMSDIAHAVSSRMARWRFAHDVLLRTSQSSVGGARRNRTDDLLLAKQALSQLSYGPSRPQGSEASTREERARRYRYLIPESGGPGKT